MREIVIISGKGGTGKTTVCAAFAHLAENKVICDLDVDAPDLHILLEPHKQRTEAFFSGLAASIDPQKCARCGRCAESCPMHLIRIENRKAVMTSRGCISCFCCQEMCPAHAIEARPRRLFS